MNAALLDSNILIATVAEGHEHHAASLALFTAERRMEFAVSAHSYAETYTTLTRRGEHWPFRFPPDEAWAMLESIRAVTVLVGLTPAQIFEAVRDYARSGGIGARLYDKLIGDTAIAHGIPTLITWNVRHMRSLFPALKTVTPRAFVNAGQ